MTIQKNNHLTQIQVDQCVRLEEIIFTKRMQRKSFATQVGITVGYVNALLSQSKPLTKRIIDGIAEIWPDVNIDWLIHGTGDMIRQEGVKEPVISYERSPGLAIAGWMEAMEKRLSTVEKTLEEVKNENGILRQKIAEKN